MTRFRFRLQTLLKLREADRQQRRSELAQAYRAEALLRRQQGFLNDEQVALREQRQVALAPGEVRVENLLDKHRYALVLKARATLLDQQQAQVRQEIELRRQALAAADRDVRVLEKLRDRQLQQHRDEEARVEMKVLDEVGQQIARHVAMKLLTTLMRGLAVAGLYFCAATTTTQAVGLGILWSGGALTPDKVTRYAAVLYGLDAAELKASSASTSHEESGAAESGSPDVETAKYPLLQGRTVALQQLRVDVEDQVRDLRTKRERYDFVRQSFENLLDTLEAELSSTSLSELRETLQVLQAKQAKDLILRMLEEDAIDPNDDVLGDVIEIITSMPQDKLKKILGEFKTETELKLLHRILVAIGQLEPDPTGGTAP